MNTHVSHHNPINANELGKLAIALVYLACPAPQTRGNAHRREHTVIIKQHPLKSFFDEHQILLGVVSAGNSNAYDFQFMLTRSRSD